MAMTLIEAAKQVDADIKRAAIIDLFSKNSDILRVLPFENINGSGVDYDQEATLPGVGFRGVNQAYSEDVGVINPLHDPLKIAGGDLDVDKALIKMHGPSIRSTREKMKVKALALSIAKAVIKGDSSSSPGEFDGLQKRLTGDQLIHAGATATTASTGLTLSKLDQLIDTVDDPTHLIMNKTERRMLTAASRLSTVGGHLSFDIDEFGRQIVSYNGLQILIAGKDNTNTEIIPLTEAAGDGSADGTSIYCVSLGDGMLNGIQNGIIDVKDLGELQAGAPLLRTRVEWLMGIALYHPRAAARLWSIAYATAVAV